MSAGRAPAGAQSLGDPAGERSRPGSRTRSRARLAVDPHPPTNLPRAQTEALEAGQEVALPEPGTQGHLGLPQTHQQDMKSSTYQFRAGRKWSYLLGQNSRLSRGIKETRTCPSRGSVHSEKRKKNKTQKTGNFFHHKSGKKIKAFENS